MGALEFEGEVFFDRARRRLQPRAVHPDDFQRLVLEVVRLFGVERENLVGDLGLRDHDRRNRFGAELGGGGAAMVAVGSPVAAVRAHHDHRLGEAAELLHHFAQALEMGRAEIALERRPLEHRGRHQREELPMRAERLLVGGQRCAAVGLDRRREFVNRGRPLRAARESGYFSDGRS